MKTKSNDLQIMEEPTLEFRYGQETHDPHDGLSLFGAYDADHASHPSSISYGLVGTSAGITAFGKWSRRIQSSIHAESNPRLWPLFPGFEAAFTCVWPIHPARSSEVDPGVLMAAVSDSDPYKRAYAVVDLYLDSISKMQKSDDRVDLIVCVVPDLVYQNCRPQSVVSSKVGYAIGAAVRRQRESGQLDIFDRYDPQIYNFSVDFRRQIKARCMAYGIPIQIVRESTLRLTSDSEPRERGLSPLSDRAWNLGVALYYKAGGKPWRLMSAREGVCYVGIAYRRKDPTSASRSACCAAQMFLDSGDGIVFMGEYGPWYSPERNQFHLDPAAASRLLAGALKTYRELEGKPLKEVFLHSRSGIGYQEFLGFRDACPPGISLVGIRVRQTGALKLFREGEMPVVRGTFWQVQPRSGFLWASGFKPRLGTYDGSEIPLPLQIDIQHGAADLTIVARDIFALTKLNYNACRLGEAEPVTIRYSDAVGEILVSNPKARPQSPKFKFYI